MKRSIALIVLLMLISAGFVQAQDRPPWIDLPDCNFPIVDQQVMGAIIFDWTTNTGCTAEIDRRFHTASVSKIFVAATFFEAVNRGTIDPNTRLIFNREYWMAGNNACLTESRLGETVTLTVLNEMMINCSDNAATAMLMDYMGWQAVNAYITSLGIEGIGEVLPYAYVDRLKLSYLDANWLNVPPAMAARFYRSGITDGLSDYFSVIPTRPSRQEYAETNNRYFRETTYNTLTPRALGLYFQKIRADFVGSDLLATSVALNLVNVMLFTQRLYSVQSFPGTVLVASKNGFDRGLLAEANLLVSSMTNRQPSGMVIVFSQFDQLTAQNVDIDLPSNRSLNTLYASLSPQIVDKLYPAFVEPPVQPTLLMSYLVFNLRDNIQSCWNGYFASNFASDQVPTLENCFRTIAPRITYRVGTEVALGMVLRGLNNQDTRIVLIYTAPDGTRYSYQTDRRNQRDSAIYWYHPFDMAGQWQVDIYLNFQHIHSETIIAQR